MKVSRKWRNNLRWSVVSAKATSPRPHLITILLGFISPMLALVAIYVSFQSLKTSERAMKVAQRAYLSTALAITGTVSPHLQGLKLTLVNDGSTPAFLDQIVYIISSQHHSIHPLSLKFSSTAISAKNNAVFGSERFFGGELVHYSLFQEPLRFFESMVRWHDIFGDEHTDYACFVLSPGPEFTVDGSCLAHVSDSHNPRFDGSTELLENPWVKTF